MAIIPQKQLFGWQEIDELGDLQRLPSTIKLQVDELLQKAYCGRKSKQSP